MEYEQIKQLMEDMGNSKLSSIDIEFPDGIKIKMEKMKLTAKDLYDFEIIDKIIPENNEYSDENFKKVSEKLKKEIIKNIKELEKMNEKEIIEQRYQKFRKIGTYKELIKKGV